jgi:hypothetical protein
MESRNGGKTLYFIEAEDQRAIHQAMNEQPMLRRVNVPWLVSVRNREVQWSRRNHAQLVLKRSPKTVVARAAGATRGPEVFSLSCPVFEMGPLTISMQLFN